MIEIRRLKYIKATDGKTTYFGKKLQYRHLEVYLGSLMTLRLNESSGHNWEDHWSEWKDVPTVDEDN